MTSDSTFLGPAVPDDRQVPFTPATSAFQDASYPDAPVQSSLTAFMTRISFLTGVFALGASLLPGATSHATGRRPDNRPAPQLTFRVETNYIEVDAIVTDGRGTCRPRPQT